MLRKLAPLGLILGEQYFEVEDEDILERYRVQIGGILLGIKRNAREGFLLLGHEMVVLVVLMVRDLLV